MMKVTSTAQQDGNVFRVHVCFCVCCYASSLTLNAGMIFGVRGAIRFNFVFRCVLSVLSYIAVFFFIILHFDFDPLNWFLSSNPFLADINTS